MILALNGSPRQKGNTAAMLQAALDGAASTGAETQLIQLYPLKFKGCMSCFSCKLKGGRHAFCSMKDGLTPILDMMSKADALIFGSPIYYYNVTPELLALLHRFMFSNMLYTKENRWQFPRKVPSGFVYTFGVGPELTENIIKPFEAIHTRMGDMLGFAPEVCCAANAWQFRDYSQYEADLFDEAAKRKYREEVFPQELQKARAMGRSLAMKARTA
ncbi:MAG: flavodoxin family protein [Clostridia bacterium]|nr:flavodoxin family protein [Clostridia bacterium]